MAKLTTEELINGGTSKSKVQKEQLETDHDTDDKLGFNFLMVPEQKGNDPLLHLKAPNKEATVRESFDLLSAEPPKLVKEEEIQEYKSLIET